MEKNKTSELIKEVAREVVMLLLEKNKAYGDTAINRLKFSPNFQLKREYLLV